MKADASLSIPRPPLDGMGRGMTLPFKVISFPLLLTAALWSISTFPISFTAALCAFLMILLPWWSYCVWKNGAQQEFPLFPMVGAMYVVAYALPLFLGQHLGKTSHGPRVLAPQAIDNTMMLAVFGVVALGAGMTLRIPWGMTSGRMLEFDERPAAWNIVRFIFIVTALMAIGLGIGGMGEGGRQILVDLESVVAMVAFLALFRRFLRGQAGQTDQLLLLGFVLLRLGGGVASGWLGAVVWFLIVMGVCYFDVRRSVPTAAIIGILIVVLFLQPGKTEFRKHYWHGIGNVSGTVTERTLYWLEASARAWSGALDRPEKRSELFGVTVSRASLLEPTAMVVQMTPSQVPYQHGKLYKYLVITWIPRALWPDKPSFSEANQFYQVAYGITDRKDLNKVSMAVGALTESYINFGWLGPPTVMLIVGLILNLVRRYFLDAEQGEFLHCVGLALLPTLMVIESQLAQYLSGIVQAILLTVLVFLPALRLVRAAGNKQIPTGSA